MVTAYTLAFGGLLLLGGRIADYVGRKRTFIVGLLGFAGASALGGAPPNAEMLFARPRPAGRVRRAARAGGAVADHGDVHRRQGAGQGVRRLRRDLRRRRRDRPDPRRRADRVRVLALVPAGEHPDRDRHRVGRAVPVVRESKAEGDTRYDIPGAVLATAGLVALVYGFTKAAERRLGAERHDRLVAAAVVLLVAFVVWSSARPATRCCRCASSLDRNRGGAFLVSLLVGAGLFGDVPVPDLLHAATLGYSPAQVRLRVPAVQRRHHRRRRARRASCCPASARAVMIVGGWLWPPSGMSG